MPCVYVHVVVMFAWVCVSMHVLCMGEHVNVYILYVSHVCMCVACSVFMYVVLCMLCVHCMYMYIFCCTFIVYVGVYVLHVCECLCAYVSFPFFFSKYIFRKWKRKCVIICGEYSHKLNRLKTTFPRLSEKMLKGFQKRKEISWATLSIFALLVSE